MQHKNFNTNIFQHASDFELGSFKCDLFHIIFDGQMVFLMRTDHFILTNAPQISGFIAQKSNKIMYSYERVWLFSQICEQCSIPGHFLFKYGFLY
jgi:hypothetical protein